MGNLDEDYGGYFRLFFIMTEVGNLDACVGGYFSLFHNGKGG